MAFIRYFFLGFGAIALFVGSFVIFNTLSITVAQRTREFATLRTLGASRKQVMRSVVLEGLVIGLVASVIGLIAGFGIYKGLNALFVAIGADLPKSGHGRGHAHDHRRRCCVGTIVTLLASILPAPARHAGAADRGGPRGRRAARSRGRVALGEAGGRRDRRPRVAAICAGVFGRRRHARRRRAARRRRDRAVRRRRDGRAAAGRAARAAGRLARPSHRRHRRRAGERERGPQPEPHGLDGRGADDRPHAGHGRRGARRRACAPRSRARSPTRSRPATSSTPATTSPSAPPRATRSRRSTA